MDSSTMLIVLKASYILFILVNQRQLSDNTLYALPALYKEL